MWEELKEENKQKYKTLITNFASLSEAFSQKAEEMYGEKELYVAPIVNSKFQETVFQKSFGGVAEDIANTSYDVSLKLDNNKKYLIGIKSFGISSGDQKIAQFKSNSVSDDWGSILSKIKYNVENNENHEDENKNLYKDLALKISYLRNDRIKSSKELIKGFKATDISVEAVYHVLMPSKKGDCPKIWVGETSYSPIDIDNLKIIGATSNKNPTNFKFTDGNHDYKYTSADSQLYMSFKNNDIVIDEWDVNYVNDPFSIFENLHLLSEKKQTNDLNEIEQTVSWMIANKKGEVEESSGFNGFDGATKLGKDSRIKRIDQIEEKYTNILSADEMDYLISQLKIILLSKWKTTEDKRKMKEIRDELFSYAEKFDSQELINTLQSTLYRPVSEMYIPIPNSKKFHDENPNFFGQNIGTFKEGTSKLKLDKEKRVFNLEFMQSGDSIKAYINQDNGKSIQSKDKQSILGEWILRGIFQLKPREPLTKKRLDEIGINAIRLSKFKNTERGVGIEFIWIDEKNPPNDAWGWINK
ncbi:hypothetical protein BG261_06410 [Floricoccus tropicus]|uniref:Restriction endonuclease type II NgoFVII C-terminal B3-like DNA-binding domain-containing protein n=1 Tax=Floricoccus tropicus TaxID=1859473 RepID=A0A1E8GKP6_9LACT|nr:hypothetical protein [Floricoccus tropicus]OFI48526.1 hypothetical protein BG261_06410 [Floricoccus tropicus]